MELELTNEQKILKSSVRDFLKKECPISLMREMRTDEDGFPKAIWKKMADLGWLGIVIPEEYDGTGGSFVDLAILLEAMGEVCCPGPFFSSVVLAGSAILAAGTENQKKELLPRLANGDLILSLALIEPGMGYGLEGIAAKAALDGNEYVLNGTKLFVENAHISDTLLCACRDESAGGGLSLLLVDSKSPGVQIAALDTLAYEKQCEVVFNNARVPKENILGLAGQATPILEKVQEQAAIAKCAELVGVLQTAFSMSVSYAKERNQFGKPIGSFQAVQHHCANMVVDVDGARLITYSAAWKLANDRPAQLEASMAKAWTSEASRKVSFLAHQIHGAIAFCDEHDLHLYYRKAKAGEIAFGDGNYHLEKVAEQLGM
ncbi:MAG: acyl-CoA/acyl-ACP dehydrogenase [Proteobacteria bacterium]|nr:acyl-CoA/acyl-ACP dehydrogenase [Pseudomonadota bacterium]